MANYGFKISKITKDVKTATGDDISLTSSRTCLKVKDPQSTTLVVSGGSGSRTIAHGQAFAPFVISFIWVSGGMQPVPYSDLTTLDSIDMSIDTTNIVWSTYIMAGGIPDGTYTIYYFVSETESAS